MSATQGVNREIAYRLFAAEYDDASLSHAESDEERAPNYVVTPTGARVNRVFVVGTLTEVSSVNDEMVRARVVDPTGAYVVYAGQYQPDQLAFLERAEAPAFVAVTGKARTFEPEDGDRVYTSIRPESIATVDADTRDRWVVGAAEQTLDRIATYAGAAELDASGETLTNILRENGVAEGLPTGIPLAQNHYGTTPSYLAALRERALDAVRVVAGEREQVEPLELTPSDAGQDGASFASLANSGGVSLTHSTDTAVDRNGDDVTADERSASTADASEPADEVSASAGAAVGTAAAEPGTESAEPETIASDETAAEAVETEAAVAPESERTVSTEAESTESTETESSAATDPEPTTETDDETLTSTDSDVSTAEATSDELGDFESEGLDDELYELDEGEREEIEEEYGTEFTTGTQVDDPGEAGIDVQAPEEVDAIGEDDDSTPEFDAEAEAQASEEIDDDGDGIEKTDSEPTDTEDEDTDLDDDDESADHEAADGESTEDVDLQARVVETMSELDDGDGANRGDVIDVVADDTGASADAVEDAIQDALMGGQCYEPDDETLKAI